MGIVVVTPADLLAFIALVIWVVVISFLVWNRSETATQEFADREPIAGSVIPG
jgi:hypothetical protein